MKQLDIIWTLFVVQSSQFFSNETVHFSEQVMSADKYPSIFSCQMEAIGYILEKMKYAVCSVFHFPRNIRATMAKIKLPEKPCGMLLF